LKTLWNDRKQKNVFAIAFAFNNFPDTCVYFSISFHWKDNPAKKFEEPTL